MADSNIALRSILFLSILLLLVSAADSQMNRDSPFLENKLPRASSGGAFTQNPQAGASSMSVVHLSYATPPDLAVALDLQNSSCRKASFQVTLSDSLTVDSSTYQTVRVRVMEKVQGTSRTAAELLLQVPASGGSTSASVGLPGEDCALGQSANCEIAVIVDPDNEIQESDEGNNAATAAGSCSG